MYNLRLYFLACCLIFVTAAGSQADPAEERYIITTRDGVQIVVKDYSFTDDQVRFTTPNDLPGFIRRDQFASIANMIGAPPSEPEATQESTAQQKRREVLVWLGAAVLLVIVYVLFVLLVLRRRKAAHTEEVDLYPGRTMLEPNTQGHLSFMYRGALGRQGKKVIEIRQAYEQEGVLFVEGICVDSDKRMTLREDHVIGEVTDLSSGRTGSLRRFVAAHSAADS